MALQESADSLWTDKSQESCLTPCLHPSEENKHGHVQCLEGSLPYLEKGKETKQKIKEQERSDEAHPEGGWGWVIVFACFFNSFIFDGIGSSFGVLYPYLLVKFNAGAFLTSFAGSMFGAYLIMGSIAAVLIKKFGFRPVSFAGGLLSCIALVAASQSPNIYLFLLSFGVLGGSSTGLVYLSSMVIVNGFFNKRRGITNGIVSSGSGLGLFVLAPLINCLVDRYSLNGAILVLAGVLLNICVFSSLFREPKVYHSDVNLDNSEYIKTEDSSNAEDNTEESSMQSMHSGSLQNVNFEDEHKQEKEDSDINPLQSTFYANPESFITLINNIEVGTKKDNHVGKSDSCFIINLQPNHSHSLKLQSANGSQRGPYQYLSMQNIFPKLLSSQNQLPSQQSTSFLSDIGANSYTTVSVSRLMQIHDEQFVSSHYLQTVQSLHQEAFMNMDVLDCDKKVSDKALQVCEDEKYSTSQNSLHSNKCQDFVLRTDDLANIEPLGYSIHQLLKMFSFHLFCAGACLIQFGYLIPGTFLADLATSHDISSQQSALMISLIGSFNIGGRLLAGLIANMNVNPIRVNNIAMFLAAILCFLTPLYTTMWSLSIFAALYGFLMGAFPPLQPLIIVKYFGIGSLASTFGFVTSLKGIAGLIGPPLAGWIYDVSSDYSMSIVFAGVAFLLSVIVNELMAHIVNRDIKGE